MKIGITGGIGSGKTYVSKYFSKLNIPVYNSDICAKQLMNTNTEIKKKLTENFGNKVFTDNILNNTALSEIVFSDNKKLKTLNSIVHPHVQNDFEQWCKKHKDAPYVLKESAILIENNIHKQLDYLILITAPIRLRIERVMKRNNISEKQVLERISKQLLDKEKTKYANYTIVNDGVQNIEKQVNTIHNKLLKLIKK